MKIWVINQHGTGPEEPATRSYDIGKVLVQKGHDVTVFASNYSFYARKSKQSLAFPLWGEDRIDNVKFIWLWSFPYFKNDIRRIFNMFSYALCVAIRGVTLPERPDVIMGINPPPSAALAAYFLSVIKKSSFVFEVKDLWPQTLISMGALPRRGVVTTILKSLEKYLYKKAKLIIVLLPYAVNYIRSLEIPAEKVFWIPNGVDYNRVREIKKYEGGNSEEFTIMYVGGHTQSNALDVVLKAAKIIMDDHEGFVKFIFVGDGTEKPNLVELSKHLKLDNVYFYDNVPKYEIYKVMENADAFVSSLRNVPDLHKYGISLNKIFDYMVSARPVILAGGPEKNPVSESGAGINLPPEDPVKLAGAIKQLIAMTPDERIEMGLRGKKYIMQNHDIKKLAEKIEEIFLNKLNMIEPSRQIK